MTTSKGARAGSAKRSSKTAKKKWARKKSAKNGRRRERPPIIIDMPLFTQIAVARAGDYSDVFVYGLDVYGRVWRYVDDIEAYDLRWQRLPVGSKQVVT